MCRSIQRGILVFIGVLAGVAACSAPSTQSPSPTSSAGTPSAAGAQSGLAGVSSVGGAGPSPTAGTTSTAGVPTVGGSAASTCATPCTVGQVCTNGACVCATGRSSCNGTCVETSSDPANCGACGTTCAANQVCSKGACGAGCAAGLTKCGAACVDITGSQVNCGMCGTACAADQSCWQSACICPTGQATCGANGACVDVQANTANCGKCGTKCATGATCVTGACACPAGQIPCNGACVDSNADESNCGACGKTCSGSTSCLSGACLDPSTLSCSGAQANNSCAKDANVTLGQYWVTNNWWGADQGTGQTCIWSNCVTGDLAGWGQSFNWTGTAGAVKTYASIIYGWQWGWKTNSGGQRLVTTLPLQLNTSKAVNCGWNFAVTQTGTITINVAYDLYVHTIADPGTNNDPTDEIMIWLYRANGAAPIGTKQSGSLSAGGGTFDLYDGSNNKWKVHSYVRQTNANTAVLNMMDFMHDLASRGLVANSKYLSAVQAGSEVFSGQGQVQTNGFYCRVQ
jgi:xyloglucan-specific endo-beta-1,4-glucanase